MVFEIKGFNLLPLNHTMKAKLTSIIFAFLFLGLTQLLPVAAQVENTSVEVGREFRGIWIDNGFFIDNPLNLSINADIGAKYGITGGVAYVERIKGEDTFLKTSQRCRKRR